MRVSEIIAIILALPACGSTIDPSGTCRQGPTTSATCSRGGVSVEVNGDPVTCGFDAGPADLQPATVCQRVCPSDQAVACELVGTTPYTMECGASVDALTACTGRRPPGVGCVGRDLVGMAEMAWLEAASIAAFETLHDDLRSNHAPRALRRATRRARADEKRHARIMARLAGTTVPEVKQAAPSRRRSLQDVLCDNAVEGCVRETFGAALGAWVALHHTDALLRRTFRRIAPDEARHADLAWEVHRWGLQRLPRRSQRVVTSAVSRAAHALRAELSRGTSALIPRAAVLALFDALHHRMWERGANHA